MSSHTQVYEFARQCMQRSVALCLEFSRKPVGRLRKGDKTWVTEADLAIEKELRSMIQAAFPDHHIVGEEEGGEQPAAHAGGENQWTWILDPIDGTFSFVHGVPFYSSLIAVLKNGVPHIGFAALPEMGIVMSAERGCGVWINNIPYVRSERIGQDAIELVATADPYRFAMENVGQLVPKFYTESIKARTYPDALGYYMLLNGSVRAFVDPKVEIWDVAPFHVILPEAGFAIHAWNRSPTTAKLERGSSVAYALDLKGRPQAVEDVLEILKGSGV
ncbi:MAG: inositol monophosphatase [Betaproteobacteria bacterium]|nr:inositol monophosphatase [Betaproteobacteria bacterium]